MLSVEADGLVPNEVIGASSWTAHKFQNVLEKAKWDVAKVGITYIPDDAFAVELAEDGHDSISYLWDQGAISYNKLPYPPFRFSFCFDELEKLNTQLCMDSKAALYGGSLWRVRVEKIEDDGHVKLELGL